MKISLLIMFVLCVISRSAFGQTDKHIVKAGDDIAASIPASARYHYLQFISGTVFFKDGTASGALLNYNVLIGEMQFINPNGDTLAIANEETIKYITINKDSFFYDNKTYLQLVAGNTVAKLAKTQKIRLVDIKKAGGFDQPTSVSGITTLSSLHTGSQSTELTEKRELTIVVQTTYYLGDAYNHFLPATKKNLLKLFGKNQSQIETYLQDNKISFNKEEDLVKLLLFLKDFGK